LVCSWPRSVSHCSICCGQMLQPVVSSATHGVPEDLVQPLFYATQVVPGPVATAVACGG
jgi:hypothetical protein